MNTREWFKAHKSQLLRESLARKAGTTIKYLENLVYSKKKTGSKLCEALFKASCELTPEHPIFPEDERPDLAETFSKKANYVFPPEKKVA